MSRESFLRRWSRRKRAATEAVPAETGPIGPGSIAGEQIEANVPPQLPPVEGLDFDSDFKAFMHPTVDRETRNAALKKLFASPHYQVSDGLDVYVGDYSAPAELPAAMLAGLAHARGLLGTDIGVPEQARLDPATGHGPLQDDRDASTDVLPAQAGNAATGPAQALAGSPPPPEDPA
jgi:hypothetical protein